jgi:hypothetical protein
MLAQQNFAGKNISCDLCKKKCPTKNYFDAPKIVLFAHAAKNNIFLDTP